MARGVATRHMRRGKQRQVVSVPTGPLQPIHGRPTAATSVRVGVGPLRRSSGGLLGPTAPASCPAITSIPATMASGATRDKTGQPTQHLRGAPPHTRQTPTQPGEVTDALPLGHPAQAPCHTRPPRQPRHYTGTRDSRTDLMTFDLGVLLTTKPTFVLCRSSCTNHSVSKIIQVSGRHLTHVRLVARGHELTRTTSHASGNPRHVAATPTTPAGFTDPKPMTVPALTASDMFRSAVRHGNAAGRTDHNAVPASPRPSRPPIAILPIPLSVPPSPRRQLHDPRAGAPGGAIVVVTSGRGAAAGMTATATATSPGAVGGGTASPALHRHRVIVTQRVLPSIPGPTVPFLLHTPSPCPPAHATIPPRHLGTHSRSMRLTVTSELRGEISDPLPNDTAAANDEMTPATAPHPAQKVPSSLSFLARPPDASVPHPVPAPANHSPQRRHQGLIY